MPGAFADEVDEQSCRPRDDDQHGGFSIRSGFGEELGITESSVSCMLVTDANVRARR